MRSAVLILVPLALLGGVFYFVILGNRPAGPPVVASRQPATRRFVPTTAAVLDPQAGPIGQSGDVWVESRSPRTRQVTSRFRAQRFDPRPDGDVDVVRPEAQFLGEDGGVVTLEGSGGKVSLSQAGDRGDVRAMGASTPTAGELRDVVIRFFERATDGRGEGEPTMTIRVPAVHFDAIGNRISTIDEVIGGKGVLAEEVPVEVRGRDFEFDGQGLTMRWNDRDSRLDLLEIAKGKRLLIKNLASFGRASASARTIENGSSVVAASPAGLFVGLVVAQATDARPVPAASEGRELYHAAFDRDVRVTRDGVQLAAADVMRVVLPLGESKAKPESAVDERARRRARAATRAATAPTERRRERSTAAAQRRAATTPALAPSTMPSGPIEIRWDGKLTVRPAALVDSGLREQRVELVGAPAWVAENGGRVEARLIRVEPDSGRLRLEAGGPVRAVELRDAGGASLRSRSPLTVDRSAGTASIDGAGTLVAPATATGATATTVKWSKRLDADLGDAERPWLSRITLDGEASVAAEGFALASDALTLRFDGPGDAGDDAAGDLAVPSADVSLLRGVHAAGAARLDVGAGDARRTLRSDQILLGMIADGGGSAALKTVRCDGAVTLEDAGGFALACGVLDVETRPFALGASTRPAADDPLDDVLRLVARDAVRLRQADGTRAEGDLIELAAENDGRSMRLAGKPALVATRGGTLEGESLRFDVATGDVSVPGPGRFAGVDEARPGAAMTVAWTNAMATNGAAGTCDLDGDVRIDAISPDGTRTLAGARRARLEFALREPTTLPSTAPAATRPARAAGPTIAIDALRSVRLDDDVDVAMQSAARSASMQSRRLDVDLERGVVTSPDAGRLLILDVAPSTQPSSQPSPQPTTMPAAPPAVVADDRRRGFGPGSLALAWQDGLEWRMRDGEMTMTGGIRFGFERDAGGEAIRMTCDRVVCGITPIDPSRGRDALAAPVALTSIDAERNVAVRSSLASFDADALRYDARTHRATATGTPETPVEVFDADATSRVGFSSVTWDVETGLIEDFRDIRGRMMR